MELQKAEVLIDAEAVKAKVQELGARLTAEYQGKDLLVVGILKGSVIFMADLLRAIDLPLEIDFMAAKSYGDFTISEGKVRITKDLDKAIAGRHILIVEDIIDTGKTLSALNVVLKDRGAASIRVCALLDKPDRREVDFNADYVGFVIPDKFIVGYGLDYAEAYRNLPYVGFLNPDDIK